MIDDIDYVKVRLAVAEAHVIELVEMLTAATDMAVQRGKLLDTVRAMCDDPGGPDSWSHTWDGRQSIFADDVRAALDSGHGG